MDAQAPERPAVASSARPGRLEAAASQPSPGVRPSASKRSVDIGRRVRRFRVRHSSAPRRSTRRRGVTDHRSALGSADSSRARPTAGGWSRCCSPGVVIAGLISVRFCGNCQRARRRSARRRCRADTGAARRVCSPSAPNHREHRLRRRRRCASASEAEPRRARPVETARSRSAPKVRRRARRAPQSRASCALTLAANLEATTAPVDGRGAALNVPTRCPAEATACSFTNQTLGEKLTGQVELSPGIEATVVLADFNSAKPQRRGISDSITRAVQRPSAWFCRSAS